MTEFADGQFRIERDTMGEVRVPADALWRAQTQRAVENFPVSGRGLEPAQIRALARIKAAAAAVNAELGVIDGDVAEAIVAAAGEVADGRPRRPVPDRHVPDRLGHVVEHERQRGDRHAGRPPARRRTVHPNDEVNASQSSNDVFPSSIHLAATEAVVTDLIPALGHLMSTLDAKGTEFDSVVKAGRTHLMDATPVTLGQEFHGYGAQVRARHRAAAVGLAAAGRAAAGRHRRRHRRQHAARLRRPGDRPAAARARACR